MSVCREDYHADIVTIQQDFGQFGICIVVVTRQPLIRGEAFRNGVSVWLAYNSVTSSSTMSVGLFQLLL